MLRRIAVVALILFESLWLNVIVPGHTRGIVLVPGAQPVVLLPCCAAREEHQKSHDPTPEERGQCAICNFAAHLTVPATIDCRPQRLELLATIAPPVERAVVEYHPVSAQCRGPPALGV